MSDESIKLSLKYMTLCFLYLKHVTYISGIHVVASGYSVIHNCSLGNTIMTSYQQLSMVQGDHYTCIQLCLKEQACYAVTASTGNGVGCILHIDTTSILSLSVAMDTADKSVMRITQGKVNNSSHN